MPTHDEWPPRAAGEHESPLLSVTTVLSLGPGITRADIAGLCEQLLALLSDSDAAVAVCDVGAVTAPTVATIEALARLQLTAQRLGCRIQLRRAGRPLLHLLALTGLHDVLSLPAGRRIEPWRQAERLEQQLGVRERVEPDDPGG